MRARQGTEGDGGSDAPRAAEDLQGRGGTALAIALQIVEPGCATVTLRGELDLAGAPAAAEVLREAAQRAARVILDLRGLSFMDCAGLHVVVNADARLRQRDSRTGLIVVAGPPQVQRLFGLSGVSKRLNLVDQYAVGSAAADTAALDQNGFVTNGSTQSAPSELRSAQAPSSTRIPAHAAQVIVVQTGTCAELSQIEAALRAAVDQAEGQVMLDLSSVPPMSNAALCSLCAALRRVSRYDGGILVVAADPRAREVLELCSPEGVQVAAARPTGSSPSEQRRFRVPVDRRRIGLSLRH